MPRPWLVFIRRLLSHARVVLIVALLTCAAALLANSVDTFAPVKHWLVWHLMVVWAWQALLVAGCLSLGSVLCWRLIPDFEELPSLEALVMSMAVGVVGLVFSIYILGAMRLLGPEAAVTMPLAMIAAGLFSPMPRRLVGFLRTWRPRLSPMQMAILAFGVAGVAAVYLHVLDPLAPNHDALWTHVVIGNDIAREGRLVAERADWAKNFPHLASILFAWSFMLPGLSFAMQMLMVMHTEFVLFLFTLAGVAAAVRWLLGARTGHGLGWVGFFLFPNIVIYDSDLGASADHVAAFFVVPMCLAIARSIERPERRGTWAVGGLLMGATLITKLQSAYLALFLCVLVTVIALARAALALRRGLGVPGVRVAVAGPVVLAACTVLGASPHLIEHTVYYKNPVYPFAQDVFRSSQPTMPDAPAMVNIVLTGDRKHGPPGDTRWARIKEGLKLVFTFAFEPHYSFLGTRPSFGFLFTLLSPLVLFLPRSRRLKIGALVSAAAVFAWAMTYQIDRNLQILQPLLAAVTVGVMVRVWSLGFLARAALALPLVLQVSWNMQYLFEPLQPRFEQARLGAEGQIDHREIKTRQRMNHLLPENAVVLLHAQHVSLGIEREVLHDVGGFQGLIDQRPLHTRRAMYERYRALGITHLVWNPTAYASSRQEEVVFNLLFTVDSTPLGTFGSNRLAALPETPPPVEAPYRTLALGVYPYRDGIYTIDQMNMFDAMPLPEAPAPLVERASEPELANLLSDVDVVMFSPDHGDAGTLSTLLWTDFAPLECAPPRRLFFRRSLRDKHTQAQ